MDMDIQCGIDAFTLDMHSRLNLAFVPEGPILMKILFGENSPYEHIQVCKHKGKKP